MVLSAGLALLIIAAAPPAPPPEPPRWEAANPRDLDGCPGVIVFFDSGSATLSPQARSVLDGSVWWMREMVDAGAWLEANGAVDQVEGGNGSDLSFRRAAAVRDYLAAHGIESRHIRAQSWGAAHPLVEGTSLAERDLRQNRYVIVAPVMPRAVFHIFFPPGGPIC
jgi:hypothetical protein